MSKPRAVDCANRAMALLEGVLIPYVLGGEHLDHRGADCQGLIEAIVRDLGGKMSYRGSNDMFRNACSYLKPLADARKDGRLVPGAVLFIVRKDGGEPTHYKDKLGNASHIGWYTGGRYEVVHASSSKGRVISSTLKNAWTHVGWLTAIDYTNNTKEEPMSKNKNVLPLGSRGVQVEAIQTALIQLGFDLGKSGADGIFGPLTRQAVERFQGNQGLSVTGAWGEPEQAALIRLQAVVATNVPSQDLRDRLRELAQELLSLAEAI